MNSQQYSLIQWRADLGSWSIRQSDGSHQSLEEWAKEQPELSQVRLMLSATDYAVHWVNLPGIKARQVSRALPFALEDTLIGDLSEYIIIPAGSSHGRHRAYLVSADLIDRLLDMMELHHLRLVALIPETAVLAETPCIGRTDGGWLASVPGVFEGYIPDAAVNVCIDYICRDDDGSTALNICADTLDQALLLQTSIATGYPEAFSEIHVHSGDIKTTETTVNLLQGRVVESSDEDRSAAWWRSTVIYAACVALLGAGYLFTSNLQLSQRADQVSEASLQLYKSWFPNERTANYEALFRRKIRGDDSGTASAGFNVLMADVAAAWDGSAVKQKVRINGIRYSDRAGDFMLELTVGSLPDLEVFRQSLTERGLNAEIASATEDNGAVKGRMKIGAGA
ncbi:MAG: hypothetical protein CMI00_08915 [Oceanospirillaceae bacterium]|nr:hypothetical protein [Oceanospirillaceae bacterium]|tara:strand:+ start:237 stop:1424 length:1188 start_codon:yes stop_codon:yes gene_type:complete